MVSASFLWVHPPHNRPESRRPVPNFQAIPKPHCIAECQNYKPNKYPVLVRQHGVGLPGDGGLRGAGGVHPQGAAPLDGHLRDRRGGPGQRAVRTDAGASHRRGEVLPELSAAQE